MGRPKGSKNKATLLKEALQQNAGKTAAEAVSQPSVPVPVLPKVPVVVNPAYLSIWNLAVKRIKMMQAFYELEEKLDERFIDKLDAIHLAQTDADADKALTRVTDSYFFHCGVKSKQMNPKKKAASRKGLAKLLRKAGNIEKAVEYEAEAEALLIEAATSARPIPPWQTPAWNNAT